MPKFSDRSLERLSTCDMRLIGVMKEVIKVMDITILCGHRNQEDQDRAFDKGYSKVRYPQSKHNRVPSRAVDIAPYPLDWEDRDRVIYMAGIVMGIASKMNIKLRWGGDFNMNMNPSDQDFFDPWHFELVDE